MSVEQSQLVTVTTSGSWIDWFIKTDSGGYDGPAYMKLFEGLRVFPTAKWFSLVCCIEGDERECFDVGAAGEIGPASFAGEVACFANDLPFMYWNNWGSITATFAIKDHHQCKG